MEREQFNNQERKQYYPYEKIYRALDYALRVLTSRNYAMIYYQYAEELVKDMVRTIGSIEGAFGVGFPFYFLSPNLPERFTVREYNRFIDETRRKLLEHQITDIHGGWICPSCQLENQLPDLKQVCNPCGNVSFKPRDLFKALPDIDLYVIVDQDSTYGMGNILEALNAYIQYNNLNISDADIGKSLDAFLLGVEKKEPRHFVLLDFKVLPSGEFYSAIQKIREGETEILTPYRRYLGNRWVKDGFLSFWLNLMFSLTPLGNGSLRYNRELRGLMREIREEPLSMFQRLQQECEAKKGVKHFARVLRLITDESTQPFIVNALNYRFFVQLDSE